MNAVTWTQRNANSHNAHGVKRMQHTWPALEKVARRRQRLGPIAQILKKSQRGIVWVTPRVRKGHHGRHVA